MTPRQLTSFWSRVEKPPGDGCWVWTGWRNDKGYGYFNRFGSTHRLSWAIANGDIPAGMWVLHHCDNPPCVNPDHLFLGTAKDNAEDRDRKNRRIGAIGQANGRYTKPERTARGKRHGRFTKPERTARGDRNGSRTHFATRPRGENHGSAKISDSTVEEIRRLYNDGTSARSLAERFSLARGYVHRLVKRSVRP